LRYLGKAIGYRKSTDWSGIYLEPHRSTNGIAAVKTAIEYEYEYRFTEYE